MGTQMELSEQRRVSDLRIKSKVVLHAPEMLKRELPLSDDIKNFITWSRQSIKGILDNTDHRLLVVVGPCSIHDPGAALEYAHRLKELAYNLGDTLYLVMRVYFEKPRSSVGWKGLINDPHLDGSFQVNNGLVIARRLLIDIAELGLPVATEALDPISPQYLQDLITWTAIGARTTESQTHREMASGLSSPVGFKNGTDGNLEVAINAIKSSAQPHGFLGINCEGRVSVIQTTGNTDTHIVLRGGGGKPNFDSAHVALCEKMLIEQKIKPRIMIDCSHANTSNTYEQQPYVIDNVANQILNGNKSIKALMIESNLYPGNQPLIGSIDALRYGVSITDPCLGWETTERCLRNLYDKLRYPLQLRKIAEKVDCIPELCV